MTYHNTAPEWDCKNCENLRQRFNNTAPARQVRCKRGHLVTIGCDASIAQPEVSEDLYPILREILSGPGAID